MLIEGIRSPCKAIWLLTYPAAQVDVLDTELQEKLGEAAKQLYEAMLPALPERSDMLSGMLEGRACVWAGRSFLPGPRLAFTTDQELAPHLFALPQPLLGARNVLALLGVRPGHVRMQPCLVSAGSTCSGMAANMQALERWVVLCRTLLCVSPGWSDCAAPGLASADVSCLQVGDDFTAESYAQGLHSVHRAHPHAQLPEGSLRKAVLMACSLAELQVLKPVCLLSRRPGQPPAQVAGPQLLHACDLKKDMSSPAAKAGSQPR